MHGHHANYHHRQLTYMCPISKKSEMVIHSCNESNQMRRLDLLLGFDDILRVDLSSFSLMSMYHYDSMVCNGK